MFCALNWLLGRKTSIPMKDWWMLKADCKNICPEFSKLCTRSILWTFNHFLHQSADPISSHSHISSPACSKLIWKGKETCAYTYFLKPLHVVEIEMVLWKPFMLHWLSSTAKHLDEVELLAKWFVMAWTLCFTFTLHNELGMYIYYAMQG